MEGFGIKLICQTCGRELVVPASDVWQYEREDDDGRFLGYECNQCMDTRIENEE